MGPPNFFLPQIYFFCEFKTHGKLRNPTITPSWRKVSVGEGKKKEKITPLIVDTWFRDSKCKPLGPKMFNHYWVTKTGMNFSSSYLAFQFSSMSVFSF